jgi:hypothetical protein
MGVSIHFFATVNITFPGRILSEITSQWTQSLYMDSLISDCNYDFCRKNIIRDHMRMDWISLYAFTSFRLLILLFPEEYYQRSHSNGLILIVCIHVFVVVSTSVHAGISLEIRWQWTESHRMQLLLSVCKSYFSRKNIIRGHTRTDWIWMYALTYFRLQILLFREKHYQRSHGDGLNLVVWIHLFPTVTITFVAGILSEITWEWTQSLCMDSHISDCNYYFSWKNIIGGHMPMD